MRNFKRVKYLLILLLNLFVASIATAASNSGFVYSGRILRPDGQPINSGIISITVTVRSPAPTSCLLYQEKFSGIDMNGKAGTFSVTMGLPTPIGTRLDSTGISFNQVMSNADYLNFAGLTCASGTTYDPAAKDERVMSATFEDGANVVTVDTLEIKSVPYAMHAAEVGGYGITNLPKISGAGSATVLTPEEYDFLKNIAAPAVATSTPCAATQILKMNAGGTAWECSAAGAGESTTVSNLGTGTTLGNLNGTAVEFKSIAGTLNQINISDVAGTLTLSLPQSIHTGATPTFATPTAAGHAVIKSYADANLLGQPVAAPGAGQVGQAIRWNAANTAWEYYTPSTGSVTSVGIGTNSDLVLSVASATTTPTISIAAGSVTGQTLYWDQAATDWKVSGVNYPMAANSIPTNSILVNDPLDQNKVIGLAASNPSVMITTGGTNAPTWSIGSANTFLKGGAAGVTWSAIALGTADVSGVLTTDKGGTGASSYTNGQILVGQTAGNTLSKVSLNGDATMTETGLVTVQGIRGKSVSATAPTIDGQIYQYEQTGGTWVTNSAVAPTAGQVLKWNNVSKRWEPGADNDAGIGALVDGIGTDFNSTKYDINYDSNSLLIDGSNRLQVNYDDATIGVIAGVPNKLGVKAGGIANAQISGTAAIARSKLANSTNVNSVVVNSGLNVMTETAAPTAAGQFLGWDGSVWAPVNVGVGNLSGGANGDVLYRTGGVWTAGTPNTAGIVDLANAQTISGAKTFTSGVLLRDADTNTITLQSPALAANYSLTLPDNDGASDGQVLTTDGNGVLRWTTPTVGTVTSVTAGAGLAQNGTAAAPQLDVVAAASGALTVNANDIAVNYDNSTIGVNGSNQLEVKNGSIGAGKLTGGAGAGEVLYTTAANTWAVGTSDTAGLVTKAGAQTITGAKTFTSGVLLRDADTDTITLQAPALAAPYSLTFPDTAGTANYALVNSATPGQLTWAAVGTGSVTSVSVTSANGFAGSVATNTTTPAITISTSITGVLKGNGTAISAATASDIPTPMTTLGDVMYGGAAGANTRLAGNTTTTKKFLRQTGDGVNSAAPAWDTLVAGDIPDVSGTYVDRTNAQTVGGAKTFTTSIALEDTDAGTNKIVMQAPTTIAADYTLTWPAAVAGSAGQVLTSDTSGNLSWTTPTVGTVTSVTAGAGLAQNGTAAAPQLDVVAAASGALTVNANDMAVNYDNSTIGVNGSNQLEVKNTSIGAGKLTGGATGNVLYATAANTWTAGTPDSANLVTKDAAQTITGAKTFTSGVLLRDADTNTITLQSPALAANYNLTFPNAVAGSNGMALVGDTSGNLTWAAVGTGSVTTVSVSSANGFAGSVTNAGTTPAITISTSVTGMLKGNGTAISAASAGTDFSAGTSALATGILKSTTTTGALSIATAADIPTPMTTLGDTMYGGASGANTRLAGNTTTTKKFLRQTGDGTNSAAPAWDTLVAGDIPDIGATYWKLGGNAPAATGALGTTSNQDLSIITNNTAKMTVLKTGEVGIGTASPAVDLEIEKTNAGAAVTVEVNNLSTANNSYSQFFARNGAGNAYTVMQQQQAAGAPYSFISAGPGNTAGMYIDVNADAPMMFRTNAGSERMRIKGDGNVGIGSNNPLVKLDVADTNLATSAIIVPRAAGAFSGTAADGMIRYNSTATKFEFRENGAWVNIPVGAGAGSVTSVSVTTANGFGGTVATNSTTPAITITTGVTGMIKGNGTAISAATAGTDFSAGTSALATGILKSTTTTGALSIATAADIPTPMTTLGDVMYGGASGANTRLAGNTTTTKKFLRQTGDGTNSAAPAWDTLVAGDIPDIGATYWKLGGNAPAATGVLGTTSNQDLSILTNNTPKMTVLKTGEVGVGIAAPLNKLHVYTTSVDGISIDGTTSPNLNFRNSGVIKAYIGLPTAPGGYVTGSVANDLAIDSLGGNILFSTDSGTTAQMYLKNGGNVGIGTTNPTSRLHTQATTAAAHEAVRIENLSSTGYSTLWLGSGNDGLIRGNPTSGSWTDQLTLLTSGAKPIAIATGATERMRVTGTGEVGIGVAAPDAALHIKADHVANHGTLKLQDKTDAGAAAISYVSFYDSANATTGWIGDGSGSDTGLGMWSTSGSLKFGSNNLQRLMIPTDGGLEFTGLAAAPGVSTAGASKIYYNTTDNKLKVSYNGAAYADLGGGGGSGTVTSVSVTTANGFGGTVATNTTTPAITITTGVTGILKGNGTGVSAATAADIPTPMTTLGDTMYGGAAGATTRLPGNTTTTKKFLRQTGDGTNSAAPAWDTLVAGDIPDIGATYWKLGGNAPAATGVFGTTSNQDLSIITNNAAKMTILKTGEVGIGTAAPSANLHVAGASIVQVGDVDTNPGTLVLTGGAAGSSAGGSIRLQAAADHDTTYNDFHIDVLNDYLRFGRYGNTDMVLNSAGNFGIGTTAPAGKIHAVSTDTTWTGNFSASTTANGSYGVKITAGTSSTDMTMRVKNAADNVDYFYIRGDGNVGIGTTSPQTVLHVNGVSTFERSTQQLQINPNWLAAGTNARIYTAGGKSLAFGTDTTESGSSQLWLKSDGNVGIGNTNPLVKLDVVDTNLATSAIIVPRAAGAFSGTAANGMLRYNSTANKFEFYENSAWVNLGGAGGGVTAVGAVGAAPNANGASISGVTLTLQPADATNPGVVTTGAQTIAGAKTYSADARFNGNVGIGKAPAAGYPIDITSATNTQISLAATGANSFARQWFITDHATQWNVGARNDGTHAGGFSFENNNAGWASKLFIKPTGEVGIGTITPDYTLDVEGAGTMGLGTTGASGLITFKRASDGAAAGYVGFRGGSSTEVTLDSQGGGGTISLRTNNAERMNISAAGVTTINGQTNITGNTYIGNAAGTAGNALYLYGSGTANVNSTIATSNGNLHIDSAEGGFPIYLNWSGGTGGTIFGNGAAGPSGASVSSTGVITATSFSGPMTSQTMTGTYGSIHLDAASAPYTSSGVVLRATGATKPYVVARLGTSDANSAFGVYNSGDSEIFRVRADGNVGIGTGTPSAKLEVSTAGTSWQRLANIISTDNAGRPWLFVGDGAGRGVGLGHTNTGANSYGWLTYNGLDPTAGQGLIMKSDGSVGVGTTTPGEKFSVAGDIGASGVGKFGAYAQIGTSVTAGYYQDSTNGAYRAMAGAGDRGYYFQGNNGATNNMYVGLAGTYVGRVGISTTTPASTLDVNGLTTIRGGLDTGAAGGDSGQTDGPYKWGYQEAGPWNGTFPDLILGYHTGVKLGAHPNYGGVRFYADHPKNGTPAEVLSVGNGDGHVRVANNLIVSGTISGSGASLTNVPWSSIASVPTTVYTSAARPGSSKLYRRDNDSGYNVQTHWDGTYWVLQGYNGDTYHAPARVGLADAVVDGVTLSTAQSITGKKVFIGDMNKNTGDGTGTLEVRSSGNVPVGIAFHRPGAFASKLTLDTDNIFHFGGWSDATDGGTVKAGNFIASRFSGPGNMGITTAQGANILVNWDNGAATGTNWQMTWGNGQGGAVAYMTYAGAMGASAYYYFSDEKLKHDIQDGYGLNEILKLRGVNFKWNSDDSEDVGLIAQEVEKVMPELVTDQKNGYKGVKYGNLVSPLINSTKQLYGMSKMSEKQMKELDARLAKVERKVASVEESVSAQQKIIEKQQKQIEFLMKEIENLKKTHKKK